MLRTELFESSSNHLDRLSDKNQKCSDKYQIWSENVQCPTVILSTATTHRHTLQKDACTIQQSTHAHTYSHSLMITLTITHTHTHTHTHSLTHDHTHNHAYTHTHYTHRHRHYTHTHTVMIRTTSITL